MGKSQEQLDERAARQDAAQKKARQRYEPKADPQPEVKAEPAE